jgi:transposase
MGYVTGESRYQAKIMCLDDFVGPESKARFIDSFVNSLNMVEMEFKHAVPKGLGRKPYDPACLVKLIVYGYEDRTRSSRKLEELTNINIEVIWLMEGLTPDFKTIADFRKDNIDQLNRLLSEYNSFADYCGLFGKGLAAIDGTKISASNNKKNNYSKKKLIRNIEYNEKRIKEYMSRLSESDDMDEACGLVGKISECEKRKERFEGYIGHLEKSGENEISTVDPDARLMGNNRTGVGMAYNVQVSVDGKADLVAAFDITQNPTDHGQLSNMIQKTQEVLRKKDIMALADKGYYGADDISAAEGLGAIPVVARQLKPGEKDGHRFSLDKFVYDKEKDLYICPEGETLPAHSNKTSKDRSFFNKEACRACPFSSECLGKNKYRLIVRKPGSDVLDRADQRYEEYKEEYKLRQQIVEHVFGTVKRTMDGGYFLLRTKEKVRAEAALLFLGYNIKRTIGYLGFEMTMELMEEWKAFLCGRASRLFSFLVFYSRILFVKRAAWATNLA